MICQKFKILKFIGNSLICYSYCCIRLEEGPPTSLPFLFQLHENVKQLKWLSIKKITFSKKKLNITLTLYFPLKIGCLRKTKLDKYFCAWMNNRKAKPPGLWGGTLSPKQALMCLGDKAPWWHLRKGLFTFEFLHSSRTIHGNN